MKTIILEILYTWSVAPYQFLKKNDAWKIKANDLLSYPKISLGYQMGRFLQNNNFDLQEKLENHDVFHVLTETGITVPEEISMQFYLYGNGKRSIYMFSVIVLGALLYPKYWYLFNKKYKSGKLALPFHQIDFLKLLQQPLIRIRSTFSIQ